ncbi:universal stress protein [Halarchaeum sp. CBA1220]|uniref:universal stress protein n=1 Tax=Halarchaeum sp. CBA1220 TaxID=1853682 RepID=UPI000F3A854D|nr:universal stress protein [Halarchaeum sp. CBA1220]QLC32746.1 universal stress protein [Halarchaeum sp. CBA1220]
MTTVVVPVRYPLTRHSRATLRAAIDLAEERDAGLTILHVDLYQNDNRVTWSDLKHAVERSFGQLDNARYVVRRSFLVEETILDEVAAEDADVVVIGSAQASRWRRALRSLLGEPDIEAYLREQLDCELVTAAV